MSVVVLLAGQPSSRTMGESEAHPHSSSFAFPFPLDWGGATPWFYLVG